MDGRYLPIVNTIVGKRNFLFLTETTANNGKRLHKKMITALR